MNNPEKLAAQGTHDTRRRQPKTKTKHNCGGEHHTQTTQTRDEPPKTKSNSETDYRNVKFLKYIYIYIGAVVIVNVL